MIYPSIDKLLNIVESKWEEQNTEIITIFNIIIDIVNILKPIFIVFTTLSL